MKSFGNLQQYLLTLVGLLTKTFITANYFLLDICTTMIICDLPCSCSLSVSDMMHKKNKAKSLLDAKFKGLYMSNFLKVCVCHINFISMSYPCHIHVISMSYPCHIHVISMSYPCHIHVISMSYLCHVHVISMTK